jgi:Rrf2 family protein
MRLSKKGEYALRAMIDLALQHDAGQEMVSIVEIAARQKVPLKFLEQILLALKRAGFLGSKRGVGGGYFLLRSPFHITLGEIVRTIDGPLAPLACASLTAYRRCDDCDEKNCGIRSIMLDVRNAIANILDHITLEQACQRTREMTAARSPRFDFSI